MIGGLRRGRGSHGHVTAGAPGGCVEVVEVLDAAVRFVLIGS